MRLLRSLPRNVWVLSLTSLLRDVASEMLVHLVPLFMANVLGTRMVLVGLVEGLAETTSSLVKVFSGWLSDRLGRRKGLTVAGYGLAAAAVPLLLVAAHWGVVLAHRVLDRLGKGLRTAPRDALIADCVPPERRGLAFGVHRAADSAGAFLGLLVAMFVVWRWQAGALQLEAATFRALVLWSLVPAILCVVVLAVGAREVSGRAPLQALRPAGGLGRPFQRFLFVVVLFSLGNSTDSLLLLRAQAAGAPVLALLGMVAAFNLVYTVLSGPAGHWSDRLGRRRLVIGGWSLYALVYLGFAWASTPWHFWVLYCVYGAYYAMTEGVLKAMLADLVPEPGRRGTAYGIFHAAVGLTALPASVLAGLLWQGAGPWPGFGASAPFLFGGALALLAAVLLALWAPRTDG